MIEGKQERGEGGKEITLITYIAYTRLSGTKKKKAGL
jgi:hypothetical protein